MAKSKLVKNGQLYPGPRRLKEFTDPASLVSSGKVFQSQRALMAKAWSPLVFSLEWLGSSLRI